MFTFQIILLTQAKKKKKLFFFQQQRSIDCLREREREKGEREGKR
jgi:hypothetical protein